MLEFDPHVLDEKAVPPPQEFSSRAHVKSLEQYREMYAAAENDPEAFWAEQAKLIDWFKTPTKTLEWNPPHAKWFSDGKLNVSFNCIDRHLPLNGNKPALVWEAEDGPTLQFTFAELHERVCRMANALLKSRRGTGRLRGDLYAHGARASHCHAGLRAHRRCPFRDFRRFQRQALIDRIADAKSKILITADGGYRRGKIVPLKETADVALKNCPTIEKSIVLKRTGHDVGWQEGRDLWWQDLEKAASKDCPASHLDSEHPLYILYTSGTTGKPKGVLHTSRGISAADNVDYANGL